MQLLLRPLLVLLAAACILGARWADEQQAVYQRRGCPEVSSMAGAVSYLNRFGQLPAAHQAAVKYHRRYHADKPVFIFPMKKALMMALAVSGLAACKKKETPLTFNQQLDLSPQQMVTLVLRDAGAVTLTLTQLTDSRCPSDVVCISAGTISATLDVADATTTQTVHFGYTKNYAADSMQLTLNKQLYWLRLLDAKPYPSTSNANQPKVATLRLRPS